MPVLGDALGQVVDAIDRLCAVDPSTLGDGETLVALHRQLARLEAVVTRAVEVRDRQCFEELCDVPAEHCEIDHVQPWAEGGLTTEGNGRPACAPHNRRRHRRS